MFLERIKANADLFVRVPLGVIMFAHGSQKTLGLFGGGGFSKTIEGFEQNLGIPPVFTVLAMAAEFLGGICVLLGLLTRLSAFGIACTMLVALFHVHLANGFFLKNQGIEYTFALAGMAIFLLATGSGGLSIDRLLKGKIPPLIGS